MENFRGFRGLASNRKGFPANLCLSYYKVFRIVVQSRKFPTNNRKISQARNFSTVNNLHYTVLIKLWYSKHAKNWLFFCIHMVDFRRPGHIYPYSQSTVDLDHFGVKNSYSSCFNEVNTWDFCGWREPVFLKLILCRPLVCVFVCVDARPKAINN